MFIIRECFCAMRFFLFFLITILFQNHSLYMEKRNIKGETCFTLNHLFQHGFFHNWTKKILKTISRIDNM